MPRLKDVARFQPSGGCDLPPDPHRLISVAGLSQLARPLEGIPWLARLTGAVRRPCIKGRVAEKSLTHHIGRICRVPPPPHTPL
jgi:hypothetical protein